MYVKHTGSNTSPYETWAKAATTLKTAADASAASDIIYIADDHAETPAVDTVYTFAANVRVLVVDDAAEPPTTLATGASIDASATAGVDLSFRGTGLYIYGLSVKNGGSTTQASLNLCNAALNLATFEKCTFALGNTHASSPIVFGVTGAKIFVETIECIFNWIHGNGGLNCSGPWRSYGDDFYGAGSTAVPTVLWKIISEAFDFICEGGDLSDITSTLLDSSVTAPMQVRFNRCKFNSGVTIWSPTSDGQGEVWIQDSTSGDEHWHFKHLTYRGTTVAATAIYPTGGAKYDGTNPVSFTVAGTANATPALPYYTPWFERYHAGTSAITPYLEAVRDGSATKYTLAEVWPEWIAKTTAGSTRGTFYSRRSRIGTPGANDSSSLGAGDWTGESGTAAFMKLQHSATFTPAELGHISVRIGVSGNYSLVLDPYIRGLS